MRICMTARAINPRIAIIATANTLAERGWLQEFGATSVCDLYDEMSEALLRSVRTSL
jgi:CPA2 family monovalent cation:H+ antiporter-2